jgi:hypothetical protein
MASSMRPGLSSWRGELAPSSVTRRPPQELWLGNLAGPSANKKLTGLGRISCSSCRLHVIGRQLNSDSAEGNGGLDSVVP